MRPNRLCKLLSLVVVASSVLVACSSTSKQPSKDASVSTDQVQQHFATATDGAPIEYFTHGTPSAQTVIVSPAFTGSAQMYAEKFGKALPDNFVVAIQLRGHGQGGGCTYLKVPICTQEQAPDKGTYSGFRISRLAEDIRDLREELGLKKISFIGHSLGMNVVSEYISDFGLADINGLLCTTSRQKTLILEFQKLVHFLQASRLTQFLTFQILLTRLRRISRERAIKTSIRN